MKLPLFCKRSFLRNSFSTDRKQFWPTCRNVSLKTWKFFAQSLRKIMNLPFPKRRLFWTPIMQFRQPCRKVSANCLNFPLRFQDHYWNHHFSEKLWFSTDVCKTFRSMIKKGTQIDYFLPFFCAWCSSIHWESGLGKSADSFLLKAQKFSPQSPRCNPKKNSRTKICFLSKYTFEHVNYRFEDPAKSSLPNVIDCFPSCLKKNGEYIFSKTFIISKNVPLDMWKVVLRTPPIDFRHTVEKTSA